MKSANFVNGEWIQTREGERYGVINPADETLIEELNYGGGAEAVAAVAAADQAFKEWAGQTVYQRANLLAKLARAMRSHQEELARLLTCEVGKPVAESLGEVNGAADQYQWYAEEVKRSAGDVIPNRMADKRHLTIRHPVGPVAAISPWNFPLLLSARKLAPALAAGCTVVNRPASQAPLAQMRVFELMDEVGFPRGVVNLVVGSPAACSKVFVEDPRIKKISFTGSLEVGRELYQACAAQMKKISLELGGHSPFIVLPDMDVEEAAASAAFAKFRNMGQVCISPSRFLVPNAMKSAFEAAVVQAVSKLKIGNGLEAFTEVGPLFEARRLSATQAFVDDIRERGGKILWGGERPEGFGDGFFYTPTVATDLAPDSLILREEPFAPILPIIGYETVDEAVEIANNTPYGLAAYALTRNLSWTIRLAEELEAGMIGINDLAPAAAQCPFGGMKASGLGREGWRQGLEGYFETKYVSIGLSE